MTHICVGKFTSIGLDNGLSPGRHQAIIWTNAGIVLIGPLGTNFSENSIEILTFSFTKMRLKMSSAKWRPFCLGLSVLMELTLEIYHAKLTLEVVPVFSRSCQPFWMVPCGERKVIIDFDSHWNAKEKIPNIVASSPPADGLAPLSVRVYPCTLVTRLPYIYEY